MITVRAGFQSRKEIESVGTKEMTNSRCILGGIFQLLYPSQRVVDHDHDHDPTPSQAHQNQNQVVEGTGDEPDEVQGELVIMVTDAGAGQSQLYYNPTTLF